MIARAGTILLTGVLAACASDPPASVPADRVVLLPGSDGQTGAVVVRQRGEEAVLDTPYATARAGIGGSIEVATSDAAAVRSEFASTLQALPPAPTSFVVYFVFGQDELTDESRKSIAPLLEDMARRPAAEITVVGHADQVGAERVNDALSLRRAERVKEMLVQLGVPAERIATAGRGAREPLVRAAAGVEPRNRRAEISVR